MHKALARRENQRDATTRARLLMATHPWTGLIIAPHGVRGP